MLPAYISYILHMHTHYTAEMQKSGEYYSLSNIQFFFSPGDSILIFGLLMCIYANLWDFCEHPCVFVLICPNEMALKG